MADTKQPQGERPAPPIEFASETAANGPAAVDAVRRRSPARESYDRREFLSVTGRAIFLAEGVLVFSGVRIGEAGINGPTECTAARPNTCTAAAPNRCGYPNSHTCQGGPATNGCTGAARANSCAGANANRCAGAGQNACGTSENANTCQGSGNANHCGGAYAANDCAGAKDSNTCDTPSMNVCDPGPAATHVCNPTSSNYT
jgi:hypothetical protein